MTIPILQTMWRPQAGDTGFPRCAISNALWGIVETIWSHLKNHEVPAVSQ